MNHKERRLAAIMFTDIVGYSSMMQKDEEYTSRLRSRHREVFKRLHEQFGGQILQYFGDGTLSIFPSAAAAVECAVALQQALKRDPKVPLRVGIHTGDITFSEEEAFGDGVNIASRIEALCIPGGVFISGKVYDDIRNHARLKARSLGHFTLKNIHRPVEVFAITNTGVTVPEYEWNKAKPLAKPRKERKQQIQALAKVEGSGGRKNKWAAGLLALFFGVLGIHRFYLGQRKLGIAILSVFCALAFIITPLAGLIGVLGILAFIDFIIFFTMPRQAFDAKYNHLKPQEQLQQEKLEEFEDVPHHKQILSNQFEHFKTKAKDAYRHYNYDDAINFLQKAIEIKYDDPGTHFLIARCYSVNEEAEKAMSHLDVAVAFGLENPEIIKTHPDLAYMRIHPDYQKFEQNEFRLPRELPTLEIDTGVEDESEGPDLLEQLNELQRQWESGILTDEEYLLLQERIKSGR